MSSRLVKRVKVITLVIQIIQADIGNSLLVQITGHGVTGRAQHHLFGGFQGLFNGPGQEYVAAGTQGCNGKRLHQAFSFFFWKRRSTGARSSLVMAFSQIAAAA